MSEKLRDIERDFGMAVVAAAAMAGASGMMQRIPASDIYKVGSGANH
jgi:hypothetical protein